MILMITYLVSIVVTMSIPINKCWMSLTRWWTVTTWLAPVCWDYRVSQNYRTVLQTFQEFNLTSVYGTANFQSSIWPQSMVLQTFLCAWLSFVRDFPLLPRGVGLECTVVSFFWSNECAASLHNRIAIGWSWCSAVTSSRHRPSFSGPCSRWLKSVMRMVTGHCKNV
jgi:hypothetical protein